MEWKTFFDIVRDEINNEKGLRVHVDVDANRFSVLLFLSSDKNKR